MKYIVETSCTAFTEYEVEANSKQEAEEKFYDSDFTGERITDFADEEILTIKETEL